MCHFEGDIDACGWKHDSSADFQWSRNYGTTTSSETGPSYDHTTGEDKGKILNVCLNYIYWSNTAPPV